MEEASDAKQKGIRAVLASVVDLDGSSYRKPGVRMLILENDRMIGAVSGGCVEKDILRESQSVFKTGRSKMMTYDGRYRLGCEGVLYILLEEFSPEYSFVEEFNHSLSERRTFSMHSVYQKAEGELPGIGTYVKIDGHRHFVSGSFEFDENTKVFSQEMPPCFKLMIFGAEHDAVQLCELAAFNGWEVTVVAGPLESKTIDNFPGATAFYSASPDDLELSSIDDQTAVVLMSHNFANDLKYLIELKESRPVYLGMLGPSKRREKLLTQFLEYCPDVEPEIIENIHGPAGLNIGAETPQEIAISILSEILSVIRKQEPIPLKNKVLGIHS
jgi:xanthine/CO dehydrogenase XdhC/CoxF family maturation factor